jgi:hypothetical protein
MDVSRVGRQHRTAKDSARVAEPAVCGGGVAGVRLALLHLAAELRVRVAHAVPARARDGHNWGAKFRDRGGEFARSG